MGYRISHMESLATNQARLSIDFETFRGGIRRQQYTMVQREGAWLLVLLANQMSLGERVVGASSLRESLHEPYINSADDTDHAAVALARERGRQIEAG
jgi:hypothetical protein